MSHFGSLLLLGLVLIGPVPVCRVAVRTRQPLDRWSAGLLRWLSIQIGLGLLAGQFGLFRTGWIVLGEVGLLCVGWRLHRSLDRGPGAGSVVAPDSGRERREKTLLSVVILILLLRAFILPVVDPDSLAYHMPTSIHWFQTGSLSPLDPTHIASFYPCHWELLGGLLLLPQGEDWVCLLPSLLGAVLLWTGTLRLARVLGVRRDLGQAAAVLLGSTPLVIGRLVVADTDLALAGVFLLGLSSGLRLLQGGDAEDGVDLALGLGLLVGIKVSGIAYGGALLLFLAFGLGLGRGWGDRIRGRGRSRGGLACWMVLALLLGGYWYARTWWTTGSPLGRLQLELGGRVFVPGTLFRAGLENTTLASKLDLLDGDHRRLLGAVLASGLGWVALGSISLGLMAGLIPSRTRMNGKGGRFLVLWVIGSGLLFLLTPYGGGPSGATLAQGVRWLRLGLRYGLPFWALLAVAAALGGTRFDAPRRFVSILAGLGALIGLLQISRWMLRLDRREILWLLAILCFAGLGVYQALRRIPSDHRVFRGVVLVLPAVLVLGLRPLPDVPERLRSQVHGSIVEVVARQVPPGETIGTLHLPWGSFLSGRSLDWRVAPLRLEARDPASWLGELRATGIRWVAVSSGADRSLGSQFLQTLAETESVVSCIHRSSSRPGAHLYRIGGQRLGPPRIVVTQRPPAGPVSLSHRVER